METNTSAPNGPSKGTLNILNIIQLIAENDEIDTMGRPIWGNWYVGYSNTSQTQSGKSRFFYFQFENHVQCVLAFLDLKKKGMIEERYQTTNDRDSKYIMIYHR